MKAFYTDRFVLPLPRGHRFPMRKYSLLRESVEGAGWPVDCAEPEAASDEQLRWAHAAEYVERVRAGGLTREQQRRVGFPWSPQLVERSRRSVGATIAACRAACEDGVAVNLAGGTHHAFSDRGEGFCVFNDAVVAARTLQRSGEASRVLVVDCDVHQGDGTAALAAADPAIYTLSIHGACNYPYRKQVSDLDVALDDGTEDEAYLEALTAALDRAWVESEPDLVIYLSGADPWEGDRWGRLALTKHGLLERDRHVVGRCRRDGLPAVAMAGGYAPRVEDIVEIHLGTVQAAVEAAGRQDMPLSERCRNRFAELQDEICRALERADGRRRFSEDRWRHVSDDPRPGGGVSRVLAGGAVFEKAGVNLAAVRGTLNDKIASRLQVDPQPFFATGLSLVIHPLSPMVPTVHMNFRYFELPDRARFGGGADLTPYYLFEDDARHFHSIWRDVCDRHTPADYGRFSQWCDDYFHIVHRGEHRGVGGIFFDYLDQDPEPTFEFVSDGGGSFLDAYLPIVERRRDLPWRDRERDWQLVRRGRYVEFNLVYDRGTLFGLETGGRTESILMSMPPLVRWRYDHQPAPGTPEATLLDTLRTPRPWVPHPG